ncbi:T9SS type A sorting domain-containing protein [Lutibacter sp. HS1-25]|uniref:T9SS type A sorting domain-containing protein n=1 Tax=Lutibacter sp. HS1-25 TaxID=2485000 RepID=UPI001F0C95A3|nr:T9SS type A sorting domain-containing protein [Lutibacter sp. HS1-25]
MRKVYIFLSMLYFSSLFPVFGQIVNEGTFKIMDGTEVYFGNEYTNKNGATHDNEGSLHLNHNFVNNGVTSIPTSGTTYFDSDTNTVQSISGSTNECHFYNLEVNLTNVSKQGVSVTDNFGLFVKNQVVLTSGDLRLVGEAQLIQTNNIANAGIGKLLRDQQGVSTTYGFNYWSSPVHTTGVFKLNGGLFDGKDAALNLFTPKQILFNSGSPYNGKTSVVDGGGNVLTAATINTSWLYTYTANTTGYAGWNKIYQNNEIAPGLGYSMKGTGAPSQNYVFKGTPNNGNYSFPINGGQTLLLGNPYPSAIDAEQFLTDNASVLNEIYFWVDGGTTSHNLSDYLGGYAVYNLTDGASPSIIQGTGGVGTASGVPERYIAVGQGFFIDAVANGAITFNNDQRVFKPETAVDSKFLKTAKKVIAATTDLSTKSIVRVGYRDPEGFHRQIVLGFMPNSRANFNYNPGYDALMVDPRADELFFVIENDLSKKYVIQGVSDYESSARLPLGLVMSETGTHTIMLDGVENFTETVYVFDKVLNTTHNISEANLTINLPTGTYLDRFELVFEPVNSEVALGIEEMDKSKFNVFYNGSESIVINNKNSVEIIEVQIYNAVGQQMLKLKGNTLLQPSNVIPFNYPKGMYVVVVESNQGNATYKIVN